MRFIAQTTRESQTSPILEGLLWALDTLAGLRNLEGQEEASEETGSSKSLKNGSKKRNDDT